VCIVFDNGHYTISINAYVDGEAWKAPMPINSHADATVGYVSGLATLNGYFDDVSYGILSSKYQVYMCIN